MDRNVFSLSPIIALNHPLGPSSQWFFSAIITFIALLRLLVVDSPGG